MTVLLHPSKTNPERYRVWDRELREQLYFPLSKAGKAAAEEYDAKIQVRKNARKLMAELGINKLFAPDGSVKGLRRIVRKDRCSREYLSLYAAKKQTDISVNDENFETAYKKAQDWLVEKHCIESTYEIRLMFKRAKNRYWQSPLSK